MAVAPTLIRRLAWLAVAAVAFVFLVGLALHGERPDPMVRFKAAGLLTAFTPEEVREIEIAVAAEVWRFRREPEWRVVASPRPVPADVAARIDAALRLLQNSGPLRVLTVEEVARMPASEYAFGPGGLRVQARASNGATFLIQFGGRNPLGSARYARVDGVDGVPMLPAYVADAWEQVIGGPPG